MLHRAFSRIAAPSSASATLRDSGGATRSELMALADHIVGLVNERFGISLRREPELL